MKIGLLHPGQMGVTIGRGLQAGGHEVLWLPQDRSPQTQQRASDAGFTASATLAQLCAQANAVVSICPPQASQKLAESVAAQGFAGLFVDANAIAPMRADELGRLFGDRYIDGGVIGPPALQAGTTRLYLSGVKARVVAQWFSQGVLEAVVLENVPASAASMLKMAYAAYTKGHSALLLDVCALAAAGGVDRALTEEWRRSQPKLAQTAQLAARAHAAKAWRFVAEMREIEATFAAHQLPCAFHRAAAEVYERMAPLQSAADVDLERVVKALLASTP